MNPEERFKDYDKDHCWQYEIRKSNILSDLEECSLNEDIVSTLKVSDFVLSFEEKDKVYDEVKTFIQKHEWLGRMSLYPTHMFTARYKGILAGVVIMDMPNAFSKLLGENTKKIERLISRGACISWSPKNLASSLISYSMKWMVKNTPYRLFVAYSDIEAKELGTIYQACNFYYIGKQSGAKKQYKIESGRWVSDRYFRSRSVYKRIAKKNNIIWESSWQDGDKIIWSNIPKDVELKIRTFSKEYQKSCQSREIASKHKYCYVLGNTPKETKWLRKQFEMLNKKIIKPYPKERGL